MSQSNNPPKVFFILGGPGSGKGTNCIRVAKEFNMVHLSAGDLLRAETKKDTEQSHKINEIISSGNIVPSEITVSLMEAAIKDSKESQGFLVDGFPRKFDQADMFETGIAKALTVIYLDCSEKTMEDRILNRVKTGEGGDRNDNDEETVRKRFKVNIEQCVPVVEKYCKENRCVTIDANRDREAVYKDFKKVILDFGLTPVRA
eukprot:Tbor_TRINITY_DN4198_c0_g1::TRINITY_DN4198_c0_g1_i1::g.26498::m.26498/K13800/CMPK1, UMPK; UMP-CMP kinase